MARKKRQYLQPEQVQETGQCHAAVRLGDGHLRPTLG